MQPKVIKFLPYLLWPLMSITLIGFCQLCAAQSLPNIVIERLVQPDGSTTLANWIEMPRERVTQGNVIAPDHPAFRDARLLFESNLADDPASATDQILALNGLKNRTLGARHSSVTEFVKTIDGHPESRVTMYIFDGELKGQPAKAIAYTWSGKALCGDEDFCHVAHVFMAPKAQFEALGGGAVIAVAWLQQDVPDGVTSMTKYGVLADSEAVAKLAQYADSWMAGYIQTHVQMMQSMGTAHNISQSVISSMQSYNNALSQCYGLDCSISQGPGNGWTVEVD